MSTILNGILEMLTRIAKCSAPNLRTQNISLVVVHVTLTSRHNISNVCEGILNLRITHHPPPDFLLTSCCRNDISVWLHSTLGFSAMSNVKWKHTSGNADASEGLEDEAFEKQLFCTNLTVLNCELKMHIYCSSLLPFTISYAHTQRIIFRTFAN